MRSSREESKPLDIHDAARRGDLQTVESICLSDPLAVNSRDKHSRTPLHLAAWSGQTAVVSYLCRNKADAGAAAMDDMGAIHFASKQGHLEVVRILLQAGVSVKASNRKGLTPLHYAAQGSHIELLKYVVRRGADPHARTKAGKTALDLANNAEVRSCLMGFSDASKKSEMSNMKTATVESPSKHLTVHGADISDVIIENENGETKKRKVGEAPKEGIFEQPKKSKIPLHHLVAENDSVEAE